MQVRCELARRALGDGEFEDDEVADRRLPDRPTLLPGLLVELVEGGGRDSDRPSATLDGPKRRAALFHQGAASGSDPLDEIGGERRQIRDDALGEQTLTFLRGEFLEPLGSPQMVVGHRLQATRRLWTGRPWSKRNRRR